MSAKSSTSTAKSNPEKPYPELQPYVHASGCWAKKIRQKVHYFGPVALKDRLNGCRVVLKFARLLKKLDINDRRKQSFKKSSEWRVRRFPTTSPKSRIRASPWIIHQILGASPR